MKDNQYRKVRDLCHCTGEYKGLPAVVLVILKKSVPKKIPIVFHNESSYDDHFITKELVDQFRILFTWLEKKLKNT